MFWVGVGIVVVILW